MALCCQVAICTSVPPWRRGRRFLDRCFVWGGFLILGESGAPNPCMMRTYHYPCSSWYLVNAVRCRSCLRSQSEKCACWPKGATCGGNGAEVVLLFVAPQLAARGHALRRWTGIVESVPNVIFSIPCFWRLTKKHQ
ncbi:unnamed protein product [Ectocarpus fasciculatus]